MLIPSNFKKLVLISLLAFYFLIIVYFYYSKMQEGFKEGADDSLAGAIDPSMSGNTTAPEKKDSHGNTSPGSTTIEPGDITLFNNSLDSLKYQFNKMVNKTT